MADGDGDGVGAADGVAVGRELSVGGSVVECLRRREKVLLLRFWLPALIKGLPYSSMDPPFGGVPPPPPPPPPLLPLNPRKLRTLLRPRAFVLDL